MKSIHPDGTKGASGAFGNSYMGDMANVTNQYYRFKDAGMVKLDS